jgi:hypothetical protein
VIERGLPIVLTSHHSPKSALEVHQNASKVAMPVPNLPQKVHDSAAKFVGEISGSATFFMRHEFQPRMENAY